MIKKNGETFMDKFLNGLKKETNYTLTENCAVSYVSTLNAVLDMFAFAGSYRRRTDDDCIVLFKKAYKENPEYALKCLFYNRDARGGNGERRFFRVVLNWLAKEDTDAVIRNLEFVPFVGRYDDLYCLVDTPAESAMWKFVKETIANDMKIVMEDKTGKQAISLVAKWLKSINTSSKESVKLGKKTAAALGMTAKQYRKTLSALRKRINVLETLMSANKWDEVDFSKIPSKAGLIYRDAFCKHQPERYKEFMLDKDTKVNAKTLNPVEIAHQIYNKWDGITEIDRAAWQKSWDGLKDYYNGREENGIAVVDVSGSMSGTPMEAAVSMGAYIADKAKGPYANHFITFSEEPRLVEFEGVDIYDKFLRARRADWGMSTNIEAVFDLLLKTAIKNNCKPEEVVERVYIFSDMEFNCCSYALDENSVKTLMEEMEARWQAAGYKLPDLVYWNLDARQNLIPSMGERVSFCSGFSMANLEGVLSGKTGIDMMLEILDSEKYKDIK